MNVINFWLSFFGNITSIIGFIITIFVWYGVKSLKSFYVAKATVPRQLRELENLRNEVEGLFNGKFDTSNRDKAVQLLSDAQINVKNLMPKLKEIDRAQYSVQIEPHAKEFLESGAIFINNQTKDNARTMNRSVFAFLRSTELVLNDDNWRRSQ